LDDIIIESIESIKWPFYVMASLYVSLHFLVVYPMIMQTAYYVFLIAFVYYVVKVMQRFVDHGTKVVVEKRQAEEDDNVGIIKFLSSIIKILLWVGALVLLLSNMGINVTSLVAGLGIGGVAVALALQNILGDLFSSLAIYFDKPFKVGDFIMVGEHMGTVKRVGIKTSRIEALTGEELVISNSELTNSRIQNFGLMKERRIVFGFGVVYGTAPDKMRAIPDMVKTVIESQEMTRFDRSHFKEFGDSALIFENVYYIQTGDYNKYMDIQQAINLAIADKFSQEGIEFAFPTRTVYMANE
jgi:small-conductance mechanosensitive channel